jgi:hypothetical protein
MSRPDGHEQFEIVGRLWNELLESDGTVSIASGGVQVELEYSGDGPWSVEDADRIAVYRDHRKVGSWPVDEVSKA